jgi:hypothetical protein
MLPALRTGSLSPQEILLVLISVRSFFDAHGHIAAGRIMSIKNSKTPPGIETATLFFVAPCLSQLRHRMPPYLQNR